MTHTVTLTDTGRHLPSMRGEEASALALLFERTADGVKVSTLTGDGDQQIHRTQGVLASAGAQELAAWLDEEHDAA